MKEEDELVFQRRWAPWWVAPIVLILYAGFGRGIIASVMANEEGVRLIIPPYFLCGWLALAVAANMRRSVITPEGVRVSNMPFPCWPGPRMLRQDIWTVYARRLTQTVSNEGSRRTETTYWAGVEAANGRRIDLSGPSATFERALKDAEQITAMLNRNPKGRYFQVESPSPNTSADLRIWRTKVFTWLTAILVALAVGVYWELH